MKHYNHINGLPEEHSESDNSVSESSDSLRFNFKNVQQNSQDVPSENSEDVQLETLEPLIDNDDDNQDPKNQDSSDNLMDSQHDGTAQVVSDDIEVETTHDLSKDENENTTVDIESDKTKESDSTETENAESETSDDKKTSEDSGKDITNSESQGNITEQENKPDNQTVLRLLEEGEKIK